MAKDLVAESYRKIESDWDAIERAILGMTQPLDAEFKCQLLAEALAGLRDRIKALDEQRNSD
jgi:hypothetical protein